MIKWQMAKFGQLGLNFSPEEVVFGMYFYAKSGHTLVVILGNWSHISSDHTGTQPC